MKENKCVCCNSVIPEGGQTCKKCERDSRKRADKKVKPIEKLEEFKQEIKQWVYKHFIGVYVAIILTACLICFMLGLVLGVAITKPNDQAVVYTQATSEQAITSQSSTINGFELTFKSVQ